MSQENVEIVRRGLEAGRSGDLDGAVAISRRTCEYTPSSVHPGAAEVYRGPEGYKRFVGWLLNEFDDPGVEIHDLIDAGDRWWPR